MRSAGALFPREDGDDDKLQQHPANKHARHGRASGVHEPTDRPSDDDFPFKTEIALGGRCHVIFWFVGEKAPYWEVDGDSRATF